MSIEIDERMPHTILAGSTLGLGLVSSISAFAGFSISIGTTSRENFAVGLIAMVLVILPYFFLRELVLESRVTPTKKSLHVAHYISALVWAAAALILWFNRNELNFNSKPWEYSVAWACLTPLLYLYVKLSFTSRQLEDRHKVFTTRVLIPALFSCVMPFLFGWTFAFIDETPEIGIWSAAALILWDIFLSKDRLRTNLIFVTATIFTSALLGVYVNPDFRALTFGCLMALAMGAAEVAKRVYLTSDKKIPVHPDETSDYYLKGANWSLIVFPLGLLLLPFLITDFPTWAACIAAGLQISGWSFLNPKHKNSKIAYQISTTIGFMIPLIVVAGTKYPSHQSLLGFEILTTSMVLLGIIIGGWLTHDSKRIFRFLRNIRKPDIFLVETNVQYFALIVIALFSLLIFLVGDIMAKATKNNIYLLKASDVELFLALVSLAFIFLHPGSIFRSQAEVGESTGNRPNNSESITSKFILLAQTARWPVAIIAAAPVLLGLLLTKSNFILTISIATSVALSTMAAFLLNDYFDYYKDRKAGVDRPVSSGSLKRSLALQVGLSFGFASVTISAFSAPPDTTKLIAFMNLGVFVYSHLSKSFPILKGAVTSLICCLPIYLVFDLSGQPWILLMTAIFIFILGRELVMDSMDLEGDLQSGIKTLAFYFGERLSNFLGWSFMILSSILIAVNSNGTAFSSSMLGAIMLLISLRYFFRNKNAGINLSRVSMLLGSFAVVLNATS